MLANHVFWRLMLLYTHLLLLLQPSVLWLSTVTFNNKLCEATAKWILRKFDVSRIRPRIALVTPPWNIDMAKFDPLEKLCHPVQQTGLPTFKGSPHLSCKRDQINKRDDMDRRVTSPTWGPLPPCKKALKKKPGPLSTVSAVKPFAIFHLSH